MNSGIHRLMLFSSILVTLLTAPAIATSDVPTPEPTPNPTRLCVQERIDRCLRHSTEKKCQCSTWMKRNCQWCGEPAQCLPKGSPRTTRNNQEICDNPSVFDHCEPSPTASPVIAITAVPTPAPIQPCVQERIDRCYDASTRRKCRNSPWMKKNCQWCGEPAQCLPKGTPRSRRSNQAVCDDPSVFDKCERTLPTPNPTPEPKTCDPERIDRCYAATTRGECRSSPWMRNNCQWCGSPRLCHPQGTPRSRRNNMEICNYPGVFDHCF